MIYPYENYLKLLLLKGYTNDIIQKRLKSFCMMPPDVTEIDAKRAEVFDLLPKEVVTHIYPPSRANYESLIEKHEKSLKVLDIDELVPLLKGAGDPDWESALCIMADRPTRIAVQVACLYGMTPDAVHSLMTGRYGCRVSPRGINLLVKYLWNIPRMSPLEIHNYISNHPSSKDRVVLSDAYYKRDDSIKWKYLGENVITLEKVLKEVMNEAFNKFKSSAQVDTNDNVHVTAKWADLAIKAAEKFDKISKKSGADLLTELKFDLEKKKQSDVPTKDKLGDVV